MTEAAVTSWPAGAGAPRDELGSVSTLVADLLASARRAFDRDRETARRCIVDAAAAIERISSPEKRQAPHQGGLAPWQVRRVKAYIDANLSERISCRWPRSLSKLSRLNRCNQFLAVDLGTSHRLAKSALLSLIPSRAPLVPSCTMSRRASSMLNSG